MKKKDLEIGTIYANKRGNAYLLVSTLMWKREHYGKYWYISPSNVPSKGYGYAVGNTGVLCLSGNAEGLRRWVLGHSELLDHGSPTLSNADDAREFTDRLRETLPVESNFRITAEDYRQWPDTYEKTRAKLDREQQLKGVERDKLRAKAREYEERAEIISKALTDQGVELTWGKRVIDTLQGAHGQTVGYHSGYKLGLDDLEKLLNISNEEK